ncbi:unnamed protein product, partial [Owenia fusiformis]
MSTSLKMQADSTQSDMPSKRAKTKSKKRKKSTSEDRKKLEKAKRMKKSAPKKKAKRGTNEDDDENLSDDSDLDLEKEVLPIGKFIKNRETLINEIFHSLRGSRLGNMVPDILKSVSQDELKKLCLEQLLIMSRKRIKRIIDGDDPDFISSSGTEDESSDEEAVLEEEAVVDEELDGWEYNPEGEDAVANGDDEDSEMVDSTNIEVADNDAEQ